MNKTAKGRCSRSRQPRAADRNPRCWYGFEPSRFREKGGEKQVSERRWSMGFKGARGHPEDVLSYLSGLLGLKRHVGPEIEK